MRYFLILFSVLIPLAAAAEPYSETGLPLPRFVVLKSAETNMRKGPGTRYAVHWVYKRKHLPMEVINEFGHWRQLRDFEGMTGWMHKGMVASNRYIMVKDAAQALHNSPEIDSNTLLRVEAGVIAPLEKCDANWCRVTLAGREGWLPKTGLWGVYPQEVIE